MSKSRCDACDFCGSPYEYEMDQCHACEGTGHEYGDYGFDQWCATCHGKGEVEVILPSCDCEAEYDEMQEEERNAMQRG